MSKSSEPPKRPPTAYMLFTSDHRHQAKQENPHCSFGELGKRLGELWAKLPENEKAVYKERASKEMEAYKVDLAEWKRNFPKHAQMLNDEKKRKRQDKAEKKKKRLKRQKKDPNAPKRAMSAFMFYSQEHRAQVQEQNPDVTFGQIGRILGDHWKKLPEPDREKYQKRAEEDRERYYRDMEKYKTSRKQPESSSDSGSDSSDGDDDEGSDE